MAFLSLISIQSPATARSLRSNSPYSTRIGATLPAPRFRLLGVQRRYTCEEIAESVGDKSTGKMAAVELKRYKVQQQCR